MRTIFDITMPIYEGMPVYKNKPEKQPKFELTSDHTTGHVQETRIHLDVHTGTHVDAPLHMVKGGDTIDTISMEELIRDCTVIDLTHVDGGITRSDLEPFHPQKDDFLLFKTKNSDDNSFNPEFIYLAEDGARYLAEVGVAGVGTDALGVERSQPEHPTHKALFGAGAIVIEGLRLKEVPAGPYLMVAAPIRLTGLDAAPARVVLIQE